MGFHKVSAFHPFIFQKSGKSTIVRNLAVPRHFVAYLVFISSIRVDPGPRNRGPTSLLALKIRTPVANTGKLRSIGRMPVLHSYDYVTSWYLIHCLLRIIKTLTYCKQYCNCIRLVPEQTTLPIESHWQTLEHNVVSYTPRHEWDLNSQPFWW